MPANNRSSPVKNRWIRLLLAAVLFGGSAPAQVAPAPVVGAASREEAVVLSPFEVVADTKGYFAANTMSGTRLNSKLEDLASAISVITKEQMADFAMLDLNDVFLYAANTEGTGTFTDFVVEEGQGSVQDSVAGDPANANRIRGIGNANVSLGNFETSNRVPIDPIDTDGLEISRGPNANIFGLGNASGTVNILGARADLSRHRSQVGFRADSDDGWRSTLDLNRVLLRHKLAVRGSAVRQHDGFSLKPSGVDTRRYNGMMQFRPFRRTTLNASFQSYRANGNRPNAVPALDGISDWRAAGSPTWDPLTSTMKLNGQVARTSTPAYLYSHGSNLNEVFVDRTGITYWTATYGVTGTTPFATMQTNRKIVVTRALVQDTQPLIGRRVDMISDKAMYDWSRINLAAPNRFRDDTRTWRAALDQVFFETPRHSLAAQFGFMREKSNRFTRYVLGDGATSGPTGQLGVDVNERLLDGSANPFFMRPLLAQPDPRPLRAPLLYDTYRGQLAYRLDWTANRGWSRHLGAHQFAGYAEYKRREQRSYRFYEAIASDNPWMFSSPTANRSILSATRPFLRLYVGDNQGQNIDYHPGSYAYGNYTYVWGNAVTGEMNREAVTLGEVPAGIASGSLSLQKTQGAIAQSHFLQDCVVTTFGVRRDRNYTRYQNPTRMADRGLSYDYEYMEQWQGGDWQNRNGQTRQAGCVVRPLRGLEWLQRWEGAAGLGGVCAGALRRLALHYNQSDSFKPAAPAQNVFGEWLPDPGGRGKDFGLSFSSADGRFYVKINRYETKQINSRSGASAGFAKILWSMDYTNTSYGLQQIATEWITETAAAAGRNLSEAELNAELEKVMGVPARNRSVIDAIPTSETDDIVGRGHEVELHFNPTRHWTLHLGMTEKEAINSRLAPNVTLYAAQRLKYWETVVDPRTGTLWWNTLYGGLETPFQSYRRTFANPLQVAKATEGLARPQVRRYGGSLSTNIRLAGITEQAFLKAWSVGGAVRYESRAAIGYWGVQKLPDIITDYDINRPIWDGAHWYFDGSAAYRTRLWKEKVNATFQLNVRNIQEGGRLQPIAALPDGSPYSFRIVPPRQFILSATFDL